MHSESLDFQLFLKVAEENLSTSRTTEFMAKMCIRIKDHVLASYTPRVCLNVLDIGLDDLRFSTYVLFFEASETDQRVLIFALLRASGMLRDWSLFRDLVVKL